MNFVMGTLLSQLQSKNPRAYEFINSAMGRGVNPSDMLSQMLGNSTKEQREMLIRQAKNYGCPESYLKQIQNFK